MHVDHADDGQGPQSIEAGYARRGVRRDGVVGSVHDHCAFIEPGGAFCGRMCFPIWGRYAQAPTIACMRVLLVEDEPLLAGALRDGLRLEAITADIAPDG